MENKTKVGKKLNIYKTDINEQRYSKVRWAKFSIREQTTTAQLAKWDWKFH